MRRLDNWPEALNEYFESKSNTPFELGVNDCGIFACGAIDAMCGSRLSDELKLYHYTDAETERDALIHLAGIHGIVPVVVQYAQRGDIVLHTGGNGPSVLVVSDGKHALGPGTDGPVSVLVSECEEAWRV